MQQVSSNSVNTSESRDLISEESLIAFILQNGSKAASDIASRVFDNDFTSTLRQCIYRCCIDVCEESDIDSVLTNSLMSKAKYLGIESVVCSKESIDYIDELRSSPVANGEIDSIVRNVKFWSVSRSLKERLLSSVNYIDSLTGNEGALDVISNTEESVFGFLPDFIQGEDIVNLGECALEHMEYIAENPMSQAGLPTGYMRYDQSIGGGYRRGTVNVVGARPKVGKSTFCLNVAKNVASNNVPVLYLDTEMKKETQAAKLVSLVSKVGLNSIETGEFASKENLSVAVSDSLKQISSLPISHANAAGKKPSELLSIVRRWLSSVVGKDENGHTNDCLIILDYLKTMDLGDLGSNQEYQYLGDFITKMHNFAIKYDVPILSTVQLNRDGINREDGGVVSGSDRILWLCSSLAFLKKKTDEDVAAGDSKANGDRKMIVIDTRYGSGMDASCEYVNMVCNLDRCEMVEGKYNYEIIDDQNSLSGDGSYDNDNDSFEF